MTSTTGQTITGGTEFGFVLTSQKTKSCLDESNDEKLITISTKPDATCEEMTTTGQEGAFASIGGVTIREG